MTDIKMLKTAIEESGFRNRFIADKLGLSPEGFYKKLRGETEFKVSEVERITDLLKLTSKKRDDIFFSNK